MYWEVLCRVSQPSSHYCSLTSSMKHFNDSCSQEGILKAIQELDTIVGMSLLIRQNDCANNEHYKRTGWTIKNGA